MHGNKRYNHSSKSGRGIVSSITNLPGNIIDLAKKAPGTVLNRAIDLLPIELHIPGYNYCGPGTKLEERLKRGDKGINPLDSACMQHDIAYYNHTDSKNRAVADKILTERAWERVKASDASIGEKAAAWAVTNIMKAKTKFGGRIKKRKVNKKKRGRGAYLEPYQQRGCGMKNRKKRSTKVKRRRV